MFNINIVEIQKWEKFKVWQLVNKREHLIVNKMYVCTLPMGSLILKFIFVN
jgi:hypothetical protein